LYSDPSKYYYSGYAHSRCNTTAKNCSTGCCTTLGSCAANTSNCVNYYTDFYSNPTKYYLLNTTSLSSSTTQSRDDPNIVGSLAGGITGGFVLLILLIVFGIKYCRGRANQQALANNPFYKNQSNLNGSTIIMTNTPQPVYGMNQPMQPMMQPPMMQPPMMQPPMMQPPMMQPPMMQPMMQPAYPQPFQPGFDPLAIPQSYNQGMPPMGMGMGTGPSFQQGPILY
jgi:hypothetical protein